MSNKSQEIKPGGVLGVGDWAGSDSAVTVQCDVTVSGLEWCRANIGSAHQSSAHHCRLMSLSVSHYTVQSVTDSDGP